MCPSVGLLLVTAKASDQGLRLNSYAGPSARTASAFPCPTYQCRLPCLSLFPRKILMGAPFKSACQFGIYVTSTLTAELALAKALRTQGCIAASANTCPGEMRSCMPHVKGALNSGPSAYLWRPVQTCILKYTSGFCISRVSMVNG